MKRLLKSKKALSPVIAAIILIAVTVAVSIAVAVWMGAITFNYMETRELQITSMTFDGTSGQANANITLTVTNPGSGKVTVQSVKVNDVDGTWTGTSAYNAGADGTITVTSPNWIAGNKYRIALVATDGTLVGAYEKTA
jgi:flagellin-like protein